jgi:hypothetical protein
MIADAEANHLLGCFMYSVHFSTESFEFVSIHSPFKISFGHTDTKVHLR